MNCTALGTFALPGQQELPLRRVGEGKGGIPVARVGVAHCMARVW